jgi:predicted nucleotidyltransferase
VLKGIVEQAAPERVILFGSAVTRPLGTVNDLDFLVIVPDSEQTAEVVDRLNLNVRNKAMPCDFLVATHSALSAHSNDDGSVYAEALSKGRVIYTR